MTEEREMAEIVKTTTSEFDGKTLSIKVFATKNNFKAKAFLDDQPYKFAVTASFGLFLKDVFDKKSEEAFFDDLIHITESIAKSGGVKCLLPNFHSIIENLKRRR
jgi:hypothetical protein